MSFYCGIDLGARKSHLCLINENDKRLLDKKMNNDLDKIEYKLYPYKSSLKIVAESTFNWEWLVYGLQHRDYDVQLAHTLELKAISWSKKKTDKWDAFTLARLLRVNMIPQAYIYPYELRPIRDLLRERIHPRIKPIAVPTVNKAIIILNGRFRRQLLWLLDTIPKSEDYMINYQPREKKQLNW